VPYSAYIGFGWTDSHGQLVSGATNSVPDLGMKEQSLWEKVTREKPIPVLSRGEKTLCVHSDKTSYGVREDPLPELDCATLKTAQDEGHGPYIPLRAILFFQPDKGKYYSPAMGVGQGTIVGGEYSFIIAPTATSAEVHVSGACGCLAEEARDRDTTTFKFPPPPPPRAPAVMPKDPNDYRGIRAFLIEQADVGRGMVFPISENLARLAVIDHCIAMKDLTSMITRLPPQEITKLESPAGQEEMRANVNACIRELDPPAIVANRKAAVDYCWSASSQAAVRKVVADYPACMNRYDMLQAMCRQQLELRQAYAMRNYPGRPRPPQSCPAPTPPRNVPVIAGGLPAPPELAAKFTAPPPDVSAPVVAPPSALAGTVLHTTLQNGINIISVERKMADRSRLDEPISAAGQLLFTQGTFVFLKTRIIGPGDLPNSVRIGITTDWAMAQPDNHKVALSSDELVFTIVKQPPAPRGAELWVPPGTRLTFTIKN
jgi:hypothetical protein